MSVVAVKYLSQKNIKIILDKPPNLCYNKFTKEMKNMWIDLGNNRRVWIDITEN